MKNCPKNTQDGLPTKSQLSLNYCGRENQPLTKLALRLYLELQKKEEESAEEWLSEELTTIQVLKLLKDGNNCQLKAKSIGDSKEKV